MRRSFAIGLAFWAALFAAPGSGAKERNLDILIGIYADAYGLPEELLHRVIKRESNYNPKAKHRSYWGLMQIRYDTAQSMGYRGPASGLLDAETNLKYAVKYLAGAFMVARGDMDRAIRFYRRGYYYDAKRAGMLEEVGLKPRKKP
jgi:soluble lytic murein transglycosylase-like protein